MFKKSGQTFRPVPDYAQPPKYDHERKYRPKDDWYLIEVGPDLKYHREFFVEVICAEYSLRATVQRVEMIKKNIQALEKVASIENDKSQLFGWEKVLETRVGAL
jgi:hypothetical protein